MGGVSSDTLFWIGIVVLVAIVVGGGAIVMWARRSAKAPAAGPEPGFTLDDMRRLLERGLRGYQVEAVEARGAVRLV